jgi:hypothetical protein
VGLAVVSVGVGAVGPLGSDIGIRLPGALAWLLFILALIGVLAGIGLIVHSLGRLDGWEFRSPIRRRERVAPVLPAPAPPEPPVVPLPNREEIVSADLLRRVLSRTWDIPLRPGEVEAVVCVLRRAMNNRDALPFKTGSDALDVESASDRRPESTDWYIQLTDCGSTLGGAGRLLADGKIGSLTKLYNVILELRREVYEFYHPPVLPPGAPPRPFEPGIL